MVFFGFFFFTESLNLKGQKGSQFVFQKPKKEKKKDNEKNKEGIVVGKCYVSMNKPFLTFFFRHLKLFSLVGCHKHIIKVPGL